MAALAIRLFADSSDVMSVPGDVAGELRPPEPAVLSATSVLYKLAGAAGEIEPAADARSLVVGDGGVDELERALVAIDAAAEVAVLAANVELVAVSEPAIVNRHRRSRSPSSGEG